MNFNILVDVDRCSGCQACVVACMDQNDFSGLKKEEARRQVFSVESGSFPEVAINYLSFACMHCEEAPCVNACPTGGVYKDRETGIVQFQQDFCIGCHSCSLACPFGIPRYGLDGKMLKCDMCSERIKYGFEPACVHTCPTKALKFGEINERNQQIETKAVAKLYKGAQPICNPVKQGISR